jgi:3-phenylpropionate/trans-cinnamate dioxygenase ferredoxin reductase subunit
MMRSIAVVGASLAGLNAALTLRNAGFTGRLVVFGDEPHMPYDRPPLSKEIARGEWGPDKIVLRREPVLDDVEWRLGVAATGLDAASRTLHFADGAEESFDGIVIATGATPRRLVGTEQAGVHVLRSLDDALALKRDLARPGARLAVVGGGFVGQEVAASARSLGIPVTMIEAVAPAAHVLGNEVGDLIADMHRRNGVDVRLAVAAEAFEGDGRLASVHLSDGSRVAADVAVLGIGVTPNTGWLEGSGLALDNGILCDETCLAAPGIVAAGDVARWPNHRFGELRRVEHWDNAVRQGAHAARRLLAASAEDVGPYTPIPWFWSDQYGLKIQVVGSTFGHDEVRIVESDTTSGRLLALYRRQDRLVAALGIANVGKVVRYRRLLDTDPLWKDSVASLEHNDAA